MTIRKARSTVPTLMTIFYLLTMKDAAFRGALMGKGGGLKCRAWFCSKFLQDEGEGTEARKGGLE